MGFAPLNPSYVLSGLGVGNLVLLPLLILQREFPAGDVGRAVALPVLINQAAFALAPAILGLLRDIEGDYTVALALTPWFQPQRPGYSIGQAG